MSLEVVYFVGPGATERASAIAPGMSWTVRHLESVPASFPAESIAAVVLMQSESSTEPAIRQLAEGGAPNKRPAILLNSDLASFVNLTDAIERAWIRQSLEQFSELGGDEFVGEMLELFHSQTEQFLEELTIALNASNAGNARRIVHTLKSTFANYGGRRLQKTSQLLENEAANGNLQVLDEQFDDYALATRTFRTLLNSIAAEFSSPLAGR